MINNLETQERVYSPEPADYLSIKISNADSIEIIQLLLEKQIPFSISSGDFEQTTSQLPSSSLVKKTFKNINKGNNEKEKLIRSIYQKYIVDEIEMIPPKIDDIAKEIGMTGPKFKSYFSALYGGTFYQVYVNKKMEYAAHLLNQGIPASTVSARIGYSHPIKFNKMFQKHFGVTPKKYQKSNQIHKTGRTQ